MSERLRRRFKLAAFIALLALVVGLVAIYVNRNLDAHNANGVVFWDSSAALTGINVIEEVAQHCLLVAMDGTVLSQLPMGHICRILENGDLITTTKTNNQHFLHRIAPGEIKWRLPLFVTHDVVESPIDHTLWAINKEMIEVEGRPTASDVIYQISADGKPLFRWSLYEHLDQLKALNGNYSNPFLNSIPGPLNGTISYTHINSLQVIPDNRLADRVPAFRAGNILISENHTTQIYVLDPAQRKLIWARSSGPGRHQHTPNLLQNENILFFYNNQSKSTFSTVQEFSPVTGKIVWQYQADPPSSMHTDHYGSAQRLENGNTLISNAGGGAIEVTPQGRVVWKWVNPALDQKTNLPTEIYRIRRVPEKLVQKWIDQDLNTPSSWWRRFLCRKGPMGLCRTEVATKKYGLAFADAGFTRRDSGKGDDGWISFEKDGQELRARTLRMQTEQAAEKRAEDSMVLNESMFQEQESPYPDRISNSIQCREKPERLKATSDLSGWTKGLRLWANDRFVYGTCERGQMTKRSALLFRYCKASKKLFEIRYFVHDPDRQPARAAELDAFINTIGCAY